MEPPYPPLLDHILGRNEYMPFIRSREVERHREEWRQCLKDLITCPPKDRDIADRFHRKWHESHHRIRELVADDDLLVEVMWVWLPRYDGPAAVLFRGENVDRFESGRIGTAWTANEETAATFARGLNAEGKGGVLLKIHAAAAAIIAGPSTHSGWLGESEYNVDVRGIDVFEEVRRFPRSPF